MVFLGGIEVFEFRVFNGFLGGIEVFKFRFHVVL